MSRRGLPLAMIVVLAGGCAREDATPPADSSARIAKPQAEIAKSPAEIAKPPAESRKQQADDGRLPAGQTGQSHDQFGLPLVIHVEAPGVPPEIENPSPPIKEKPEPPTEPFNLWQLFQQKPKPP